ncbi:MAG: hypothetical protein JST84_05945 [Acidobacteria bacterium]|nr:hypothetical protein [Acidobacteriota bacterium]
MQNFGIRILLNNSILGGNIPDQRERRFARVVASHLQAPEYNAKYFETLPTMWATAYVFQRAVEKEEPKEIEEWAALLALDYFGVLELKKYEPSTLQQEYDRDLWPAISGTYPSPQGEELPGVFLLHTSSRAETVVGAFYPGIIFFPSRGRTEWLKDELLTPYLDGQQLSWGRCVGLLLAEEQAKRMFFLYLRSIANILEQEARQALLHFCTRQITFRGLDMNERVLQLGADPRDWPKWERDHKDPLANYPFQQPRNGGITYYLVSGLPVTAEWMRKSTEVGLPSPLQYEKVSDTQIRVRSGIQEKVFNLGEQDRIVLLKDLFLDAQPYWCTLQRESADVQAPQIRRLHRQEITNNSGAFVQLKVNEIALCLAPARSLLFAHFPALLHEPENFIAVRGRTDEGGLEWEFTLFNQKIIWPTEPKYSKALPDSSLALWPPKVSPDWHLYIARGLGARDTSGAWYLIDEQGRRGTDVRLAEDEYINVLQEPGPNRPLALSLHDSSNRERGVLLLSPLEAQTGGGVSASLAMDFGTSNSCLAFKTEGTAPQPLLFDLSPKMLWGAAPRVENPGFVPFKWGARKGYFPTILLSRVSADLSDFSLEHLQIKHLFQGDIPGLHRGMEENVFDGTISTRWSFNRNLKWEADAKRLWRRPLFLGLSLLYAHAELFFRYNARLSEYTFTFPLAFTTEERYGFHKETRKVVQQIHAFCYGADSTDFTYIDNVDESTAIARAVAAGSNKAVVEVFVDIGGGTTDLAIRHDGRFLVLDSIKIAGRSFFMAAEKNFGNGVTSTEGKEKFQEHLSRLLTESGNRKQLEEVLSATAAQNLDLGTTYSIAINRLDDDTFRTKEGVILEQGMGWPSYQMYRTELFFRHILTYALLQAAAVVADQKLEATVLSSGMKLILSGNGWGLMLFGEFRRSKAKLKEECQEILRMLKTELLRHYEGESLSPAEQQERACLEALRVFDVDLLNERALSKAKTEVPVGALTNITQRNTTQGDESANPYTGVTLRNVVMRDGSNESPPLTIRWCDRWGFADIKKKHEFRWRGERVESLDIGLLESYERPLDYPLGVFTCLGGSGDRDPMPPEEWQKMNSMLSDGGAYLKDNKLAAAPINYFVSRILYPEDAEHLFLNTLATINRTLK